MRAQGIARASVPLPGPVQMSGGEAGREVVMEEVKGKGKLRFEIFSKTLGVII